MSVWTVDELNTIIAVYKANLLTGMLEFEIDLGVSKRKVKFPSISDLQDALDRFQNELAGLQGTAVGRTYAKAGRRF